MKYLTTDYARLERMAPAKKKKRRKKKDKPKLAILPKEKRPPKILSEREIMRKLDSWD